MKDLQQLGWNNFFAQQLQEDETCTVARVIHEEKNRYRIHTGQTEAWAECSGRFYYQVEQRADLPAVGDWVKVHLPEGSDVALIQGIFDRKSKFSRKQAGEETREQIIAANIDTVFLVSALNQDFNLRRLERYLVLAWESQATPVVILTKADLCDDPEPFTTAVESVAFGVPIHIVSSHQQQGLEALSCYMEEGQTVALLGSSGVGKSTLLNVLVGKDVQHVKEIREDDAKGRHTTTSRKMFMLPQGGMLIDTPGMREIQLWDSDQGFQNTFGDIEEISKNCRFRDCQHEGGPGCAIQAAIDDGTIDNDRYTSYLKLQREIAFLDRKQDQRLHREYKRRWKAISGNGKARLKEKQRMM